MSTIKRSHYRSDEVKADESDEHQSENALGDSTQVVDHKKRHHKKSSKKGRKHKSKRKHAASESDSESSSSSSSDSSSDTSSEEEKNKRKKQKKHKKSKRRHRHESDKKPMAAGHDSDAEGDVDVKVLRDPAKVHYISSGEDERQRFKKSKRIDDLKKLREPTLGEKEPKSKWDSPTDDYDRKRFKDGHNRHEGNHRDSSARRSGGDDNYRQQSDRRERHQQPPPQPERDRKVGNDRRFEDAESTRGPAPRHGEAASEWQRHKRQMSASPSRSNERKRSRNQDVGHEIPERHRRPETRERGREPERIRDNDRPRFMDNRNQGRVDVERRRSFSPRNNANRNRGGFNDNNIRRDNRDNSRRGNFNDNRRDSGDRDRDRDFGNNRRADNNNRRDFNNPPNNNQNNRRAPYERRVSVERNRQNDRDRSFRDRDAAPARNDNSKREHRDQRERVERSPVRSNPFRRNDDRVSSSRRDERTDFRPGEQRPDRNDRRSSSNARESSTRNEPTNRRKNPKRESDNENYEWGKTTDKKKEEDDESVPVEKEKPNFGLSGKLTEDTNKVNGVVIKYGEPPEARRPKRRWRLYPFKGEQSLQTMHIHRQSCYLIGRDKKICELAVDHPSCSKQHAALQYRLVPYEREDGTVGKHVRPYIIDLESANGTFVNNKKIDPKKYVELFEKDVLKFGFSTREYVLLHENSNNDDDDELGQEEERVKSEPKDE